MTTDSIGDISGKHDDTTSLGFEAALPHLRFPDGAVVGTGASASAKVAAAATRSVERSSSGAGQALSSSANTVFGDAVLWGQGALVDEMHRAVASVEISPSRTYPPHDLSAKLLGDVVLLHHPAFK